MGNFRTWNFTRYGRVLVEEPDIQSPAALTLLTIELAKQDDTIWNPWRWLSFRRRYLRSILEMIGVIECHYCKKKDLEIETKDKNKLATLDHVIPVSKGGPLWSVDNLVPACYTCNMHKGDKLLGENHGV